jgi:hypothetical protein
MHVACIGERHELFSYLNSKTNFRGRGTLPLSGSRDLILVSVVIWLMSSGLISPAAKGGYSGIRFGVPRRVWTAAQSCSCVVFGHGVCGFPVELVVEFFTSTE